ncbi:MAG: glycoside hydrolase family 88 protein [Bacteroidaceae bacterium]|nr:glycoside hydrolase family 88 protein [Bacteroidaceae bacterium]
MAGPYRIVARDGQYRASKAGSERDMWTAYQCALQYQNARDRVQSEAYAAKAREIIDAYADSLQQLEGHDGPLCTIQCFHLVRAMTILKPAQAEACQSWSAMIRRAIMPTINKFEADSPYANGNWGAIVNRCRMACAIFLDDDSLYKAAVDYFLYAYDNGALPRYVSPTGQCQETGRDQGHVQLGLGALCDICEMAWDYGKALRCQTAGCTYHDLWGALDCLLMRGLEYSARYNLGYDVPFETWTDCTGLYNNWTEPGSMGRGRIWDIYRKAYDHYTGVKHLKMPYTRKLLAQQDKAARRGQISTNTEGRTFQVPGVSDSRARSGKSLHQLFTYPAPSGAPLKDDYDVFVQPRGSKEWTKIDTYMARVNAPTNLSAPGVTGHKISEISYCMFDFTGSVSVRVVARHRKFTSARIRPAYRGTIANIQNDSTVQFHLFQPENVSVEFGVNSTGSATGYSLSDNLLVFTSTPPADRVEAEKQAKAQGRRFIYIAPGYYDSRSNLPLPQKDGKISVPANSVIYMAGGAYLTSTLAIEDVKNVSILGRGIARPTTGYEGAHIYRSSHIDIDGLVCCTCPIGESSHITLHDVRSISHPGWGDGLNVFGGSSDILYDRVFCRNSDDCTTAYATRKGFSGSTRRVTMRNSILWPDVAHPIFIGIHGDAERGDTIEHLRYENIDILGQAEPQVDYQGCLAINCGDNNLVRDVLFDNIRIEQILQGSLLQVKVGYNQKYCAAPGRGVEDITFRNIRYYSDPNVPRTESLSVINGYSEERQVRNVTFEGIKINGHLIHDKMAGKPAWYAAADYIPMYVGNHVRNVVFSADSRHTLAAKALSYCSLQTDRALEALRPYDFTMMPRNILDGQQTWNLRKASPEEWCSGFWPGILWMDFAYNKSEAVKKAAQGYTDAILSVVSKPVYDHDLGFITINALLKGYEATKEPRYRAAALRAADSLATLFNPTVGTILSWPRHVKDYGGHNTIMDNMMNLELLFWAAANGGQGYSAQHLRDIAICHAETTMKNHFRSDGSCYHVAVYDTLTGRFIKGVTHQGYSDRSMWSRGQSWAIYGYTMVYRFTHDPRFLAFAQKVADIYLKRLRQTSDDCIPYWDMDDPRISKIKAGDKDTTCPKDVSAACVVASALLELSSYLPTAKGVAYRDFAIETLTQLSTPAYQSGERNVSFLLHSTGHHPAGSEIDASIIYADYYYIEALSRAAK